MTRLCWQFPRVTQAPRPLTAPHHHPPLHLLSPGVTHRSQARHLWPSHTCCVHTLKVHRTDTCVCHPTPPLKQLAAVSIYHRSPDRAQIPMQFLCAGRRELMFFEHLLCAMQHTEPFTCAFFLKLFISPLKFILQIVNMRPREMTPITQRVGCPPGMVPLDPAVPPLPHPCFSAEEK